MRYTARSILILVSVCCFIFALLSGSEKYGGGLKGILLNSPNALPWLVVFIFAYVSFKRELLGGVLIFLGGIFSILFFEAYTTPAVLFSVSAPLMGVGSLLILSWYIDRK